MLEAPNWYARKYNSVVARTGESDPDAEFHIRQIGAQHHESRLATIDYGDTFVLDLPGGVANCIRRKRLLKTCDALDDRADRRTIASSAEEWGFADASTYSRTRLAGRQALDLAEHRSACRRRGHPEQPFDQ